MSITPSEQNVEANEAFSIFINIDSETTFVGAQLNILFDGSLMNVESISEGELFESSGILYLFNGGTIDNTNGSASNIFAVILGPGGINGNDTFVKIDLLAGDSSGTCNIELSDVMLSDATGNSIPVNAEDATIGIIGTETAITESTGSGGGGSGSASNTGEEAANIEFVEAKRTYVLSNSQTSYSFEDKDNPIISIDYLSLKNSGYITSTVEVLKDVSTLVTERPSGIIYRNINIWVGKTDYASPANIELPVVFFRIGKQWIDENNIPEDAIVLKRYNSGEWSDLPTSRTGEDDTHVFFEAETPGFSPFAIGTTAAFEEYPAHDKEESTDTDITDDASDATEVPVQYGNGDSAADPSDRKLAQNNILTLCICLLIVSLLKE